MKNDMMELYNQSASPAKSMQIFYCGYQKCQPGHAFGPAVRGQYLLHFIVSGKGSYTVGDRTFELHEGQAFLIRPGDLTFYKADETEPWEYMWVAFDGIDAPELVQELQLESGYTGTAADPKEMESCLIYINENFSAASGSLAVLGKFYCAMAQLEKKTAL